MFTHTHESASVKQWLATALALLVVLSAGTAGVASAAGATGISVTPAESSVDVGQTTTFDVVLQNVDGGVQTAELGLALDDPSVASITDVSIAGDPGFDQVDIAEDGSSADVAFTAADTDDTGSVAFLTVTVEGTAPGSTGLSVEPRADNDDVLVFDEEGAGYDITGVSGASLTVEAADDDAGDGDDDAGDGDDDAGDGDDDAGDGDDDATDGAVDVTLAPTEQSIDSGDTTTFDVVVDSEDVGAVDLSMSLADTSVATIQSVESAGATGETGVSISEDGESASLEAYSLQDAGADGSTTVATVTVAGASAGSTTLSLDDALVTDVQGTSYTATIGSSAVLTVTEGSEGEPSEPVAVSFAPTDQSVAPGETTTFDVVVDSEDVGAVDLVVSLTDDSVATIESIDSPVGDGQEDVSTDGQSASVVAFGLQDAGAAQDGSTTVATVTVSGTESGSTALSFDDVMVSDVQGYAHTANAGADASLTVQTPADLEVSSVTAEPDAVTPGETTTLTATVQNSGDVEGTETVTFTVGGETVATESVTVAGDGETTVSVDVATDEYALGTYDVEATVADSTASTQFAVQLPALSDSLEPPTNVDDDVVLEDVNGDGTFDVGDAMALFANRNSAVVDEYPTRFDFNDDGTVNVFDVQAAFFQALASNGN